MPTQLPIDYKSDIGALEFNAEHARRRFEDAASRGFPANNQARLCDEMEAAEAEWRAAVQSAQDKPAAAETTVEPPVEFSMPMPVFLGLTPTPDPVRQEPESQPIAKVAPDASVEHAPALTKSQVKRVASKGEGK